MPRLGITVTTQMEEALKAEADKTGAPISSLVRMAIEEFLVKRGWEIDGGVSWGGYRQREDIDPAAEPEGED